MDKMYMLKISVSVVILASAFVFNECGGRATNNQNKGFYNHNSSPAKYHEVISRIFSKVERVLSTAVTAMFVTTKTETMVMNATVTSTSTLTSIQTPPPLSTEVTSTFTLAHEAEGISTSSIANQSAILVGDTICSIQVTTNVTAGNFTFLIQTAPIMVTSTIVPDFVCTSTQTIG
ncbi:hypothetical protein ACF0H5_000578 [Mactra antiquata]